MDKLGCIALTSVMAFLGLQNANASNKKPIISPQEQATRVFVNNYLKEQGITRNSDTNSNQNTATNNNPTLADLFEENGYKTLTDEQYNRLPKNERDAYDDLINILTDNVVHVIKNDDGSLSYLFGNDTFKTLDEALSTARKFNPNKTIQYAGDASAIIQMCQENGRVWQNDTVYINDEHLTFVGKDDGVALEEVIVYGQKANGNGNTTTETTKANTSDPSVSTYDSPVSADDYINNVITSIDETGGKHESYTNSDGNFVDKITSPNGDVYNLTTTNRGDNTITTIDYPDGSTTVVTKNNNGAYSTTATSSDGKTRITSNYDLNGNKTSTIKTDGSGNNICIEYSYDSQGRRTSADYTNYETGENSSYSYTYEGNTDKPLTQLEIKGDGTTIESVFKYDANGVNTEIMSLQKNPDGTKKLTTMVQDKTTIVFYDKDGYDGDGYNMEGYDRNGYDRNGISKTEHEIDDWLGNLLGDTLPEKPNSSSSSSHSSSLGYDSKIRNASKSLAFLIKTGMMRLNYKQTSNDSDWDGTFEVNGVKIDPQYIADMYYGIADYAGSEDYAFYDKKAMDNETSMRRYADALNSGNLDLADRLYDKITSDPDDEAWDKYIHNFMRGVNTQDNYDNPFGDSDYGSSRDLFIKSGNDPSDSDIYTPGKDAARPSEPVNNSSNNNNNNNNNKNNNQDIVIFNPYFEIKQKDPIIYDPNIEIKQDTII